MTATGGGVTRTAAFTFIVVLAVLPPPATGNTFYVATNGSDSYSCSQARNISAPKRNLNGTSGGLSCLTAGDTLDIRAGTYNELIQEYIPFPLKLAPIAASPGFGGGTSWSNPVTIQGHVGETVTIKGVVFDSDSPNLMQYMIFSNLVMDGTSSPNNVVIYMGRGNITFAFKTSRQKMRMRLEYSQCAMLANM